MVAAPSLWVAPTINVDVYTQVRDQIQARVPWMTFTQRLGVPVESMDAHRLNEVRIVVIDR
jgi:hypothetical protein